MKRPIYEIAQEIEVSWKKPSFNAKPYLQAMYLLESVNDRYGVEDGKSIVLGFLANASTFRGEDAKCLKDELRNLLKEGR